MFITNPRDMQFYFVISVIRYVRQVHNMIQSHSDGKSLLCMRQFIISVFAIDSRFCTTLLMFHDFAC